MSVATDVTSAHGPLGRSAIRLGQLSIVQGQYSHENWLPGQGIILSGVLKI